MRWRPMEIWGVCVGLLWFWRCFAETPHPFFRHPEVGAYTLLCIYVGSAALYWPPPAAMEHRKAPGRPQALLKKDSESDKKNGAWGSRASVSVSE